MKNVKCFTGSGYLTTASNTKVFSFINYFVRCYANTSVSQIDMVMNVS
jgi:hypothetical protein